MVVARRTERPAKRQQKEKQASLTLTCKQWAMIARQLNAVLTSHSLAHLRIHNDSNLPDRVRQALEHINANVVDAESDMRIEIEAPVMAWSRIPWVLLHALPAKVKGNTSALYNDICNQLQRKTNG